MFKNLPTIFFSADFQGVRAYVREVSASFRGVSARFRGVSARFRGVSAYFRLKLVSRTSKQVSKNLGPLWQLGVYNGTKSFQGCRNGRFGKRSFCPLPKTGGFDEIGENFDIAFCPQKQRILLLGPGNRRK